MTAPDIPRPEREYAFDDVQRFLAELLSASTEGGITHAIYSDLVTDMANLARIPGYSRIWGQQWTAPHCGAIEPGPITVGEAHSCAAPRGHVGEHEW